jgi:NRPS condensation-like uncharacterized protein
VKSSDFARPNLLGRVYLGLAHSGLAADMYYVLDLAQRIDPAALRRAVSDLLDELPQLRSRIVRHWYGYRRVVVALADLNLDGVLTVSSDPEAADGFLQHQRNLARELPIRILLHQGAAHDQIVIAVHHSLADGQALVFVVARLGECYGAALKGEPASCAPTRPEREARYRHLLPSLSWSDRWRAFWQALRYLWDGAGLPGSTTDVALATFTDRPLPARGRLRYARIGLSFDEAAGLMRRAVKRKGSLSDVLLTASLRAAITVWPSQAALPIRVSLPVSVRSAEDADVTNRVGVLDFEVRAGGFDEMFEQVSAATTQARALRPAILSMFTFALASYLPPAVFEHLARRYFSQTTNVRESLTFTVLGTLDGGPQRFGPVAVTDSVPLGSVIAPPGLKVHVSPHGGRLNLCVAYLDPVIAPASIAAFVEALRMELDGLA